MNAFAEPTALYRRISRRELHSSRSGAAIAVASVVIVLSGWFGAEIVLHLVGQRPLLLAPDDLARSVQATSSLPVALLAGLGAGCAVIGILLAVIAVSPGRRARHLIGSERMVTVVDDEVIASALAGRAARVAGIDPNNARVSVSRRLATVHLVPTSGQSVHTGTVLRAVGDQLDGLMLQPGLQARVVVAIGGKVGE